jgi:hypothetical protein
VDKNKAFVRHGVAGDTEEFDACSFRGSPGNHGVRIDLNCRGLVITKGECFSVAKSDIACFSCFCTKCLADDGRIKFVEMRRYFRIFNVVDYKDSRLDCQYLNLRLDILRHI